MSMKVNDTIIAPITGVITQAVAVIRISGDEAFSVVNKFLRTPLQYQQQVVYQRFYDHEELVDEVVITTFKKPQSFTGEDVVEIACHGGILNTERILKLLVNNRHCRFALNGEFSQRAYLHGKINLLQAQGINDLIHAPNELALKIGVNNMHGTHHQLLFAIKNQLLDIISRIQVAIDYPDYDDVEFATPADLLVALTTMQTDLKNLIRRSKMVLKSIAGIKTVIVGLPNVGKSSLLNCLLDEDKAIVTNLPGTTRDIVEGQISLQGVTLNLIDTAGLRSTVDIVEQMGIAKTKQVLDQAELVLLVVEPNMIDAGENRQIRALAQKKTTLLVVNKCDQISDQQKAAISQKHPEAIFISTLRNAIDPLINTIEEKYLDKTILQNQTLVLTNAYQINLLEQIFTKIGNALNNLHANFPIDIVAVDLNEAWNSLKELLGEALDEEIIDNIFRKYCLGK